MRRTPFKAKLFRVDGGNWFFARIPKGRAPRAAHAWGRTPVCARVDGTTRETSVWWDAKRRATLLAVPKRVRGGKGEGELVEIEILPPRRERMF